ncbi:MAG: hypothetical protein ACO1OB_12190 [Archangium sp.]
MNAVTAPSGPDNVLRVLSELEGLPNDATGALAFGPETKLSGVVLVEKGRVCWAAAEGLQRRLTGLLRESCTPPLGAEEAEALFVECRQRGRPMGEVLVERGRISPEALRAALLHHTAESLAATSSWATAPRWVPHRARGYQSAFTFLPMELLSYASTIAGVQSTMNERLRTLAGERNSAVFDAPGATLLACQLPDDSHTSLRALSSAGAWAAQSLSDSNGCSSSLKFTRDRAGGVWVGWCDAGLNFIVRCADRDDFSVLVRTLHRHGWSSAVQSSVPLVEHRVLAT